jgi:apolipoprotein D and lipocalin family protein
MLKGHIAKLQEEIHAAEQRVIEVDARLDQRLHRLRHDASRAVAGKAMAGAGLLAAGWLMRGGRGSHRREARAGRRRSLLGRWMPRALHSGLPLLLPLLTPLLDRRVAAWLSSFGLPVGAPRATAPLLTSATLDLARYSGAWHEIARLPRRGDRRCASDVLSYYRVHDGGLVAVHRCLDDKGRVHEKAGQMRVAHPSEPGRLEATYAPPWLRWFPGVWTDHCVIYVDAEYNCALVGTPDRDGLWLLARDAHIPDEARDALLALADRLGFPVSRVQFTRHTPSAGFAEGGVAAA